MEPAPTAERAGKAHSVQANRPEDHYAGREADPPRRATKAAPPEGGDRAHLTPEPVEVALVSPVRPDASARSRSPLAPPGPPTSHGSKAPSHAKPPAVSGGPGSGARLLRSCDPPRRPLPPGPRHQRTASEACPRPADPSAGSPESRLPPGSRLAPVSWTPPRGPGRMCLRPHRGPASRRQPRPALGSPSGQDRASRARSHAGPEAVLAFAPAVVGLEGLLHRSLVPGKEASATPGRRRESIPAASAPSSGRTPACRLGGRAACPPRLQEKVRQKALVGFPARGGGAILRGAQGFPRGPRFPTE